jgi:PAS domain S-box-containing protein
VFPYSLPLAAVSVLTIIASALITYRHPERRVIAGVVLVLGSSIWLMMQALELTSDNLPVKFFFYTMRYVGVVTVPGAWLVLAMLISGYERHVNKRNTLALTVIPLLSLLLIFTNESHSLMFKNASLNPTDPSLPLVVTFGPAYWVLAVVYSYALMVVGFVMIVRRIIATRRSYRVLGTQILLISMAPWALNVAYVLDPSVFMHFEPSSLVISVAGAVLLWRIVDLPIMGVLPVAHEKLIDSMNDAIFVLDAQNRIVDANPKAQDLFGRPLPQAVGKSIENVWAEWPATKKALDSEAGTRKEMMLGDAGERQVYEVQGSSVEGLLANVPYQLVTLRDITERRKMEEASSRLAAIVESSDDAIVGKTLDGVITSWNQGAEKLYGYSAEEVKGKPVSILLPPDRPEELTQILERVKRGEPVQRYETERKREDDKIIDVSLTVSAIRDPTGRIVGASTIARDITERKRAEEALRESEDRLRRITDNMLDMVVETDLQGICKYASPSCKAIMGYDPKDLAGKSLFDFVHPEDLGTVTETIQRAVSTGRLWTGGRFECRYRHADGHYVWLENLANIVYDENGEMIGGVIGSRDITERKRTVEALHESEAKYRTLVEQSLQGIMIAQGPPPHIVFANLAMAKILGYAPEELTSFSPRETEELIHPEDRVMFFGRFSDRLQGKPAPPRYEIRAMHKDGQVRWLDFSRNRIEYQGQPAVQATFMDITERKRMEDELRRYSTNLEQLVTERTNKLAESERKYRQLIETAQEGLFTYDTNGLVTFVNPFLSTMLGYAPEEMIGKSLLVFVDDQDLSRARAHMEKRRRGIGETYELRAIRKDGSRIYTNVTVSPIVGEYGKFAGALALLSDITERKRLESQLVESQRLAAIGETTTMVGHDLRNPLQAMTNTLYLVKRLTVSKKIEDRREAVGLLDTLDDGIQYMDKIVSDLQDYARPVGAEQVETSLPDLVRATLSNAKIPGNVEVAVNVQSGLSNVKLDPLLFRRVLTNLILNAVQAMPKGGRLTIAGSAGDGSVIVAVQDNGVGIARENIERVFAPFFTTKAQGQGLGLAVCKRLVELQGGTINVSSEVGRGSTFIITMPTDRTMEAI